MEHQEDGHPTQAFQSFSFYGEHIYSCELILTLCILSTFANSEDPDDMLHNAAFHQGLHFLQRSKRSSDITIQYF